jgi:hypothetical protein
MTESTNSDAPDPAWVAAVSACATARNAHHEAGHAVAAVARGGELRDLYLGTVDWSTVDDSADTPGGTVHRTAWQDQPFVTFAGPWAEATWVVEHEPDSDSFDDALACAWDENADGDTDKYESRVDLLDAAAAEFGFNPIGRAWEAAWADELEGSWPAICEVAALLIDGHPVSHETVHAAIQRVQP